MHPWREHRSLPLTPTGGRGRGDRGRPFFAYFLSAKRKKVSALPGAHPGLYVLRARCAFYRHHGHIDVRRRGLHPRTPTYFLLLRQEKVGKEKATPVHPSPRYARGNLRCSRPGRIAQLAPFATLSLLEQVQ
jgi:hypothetical protein